MVTNSWVQHKSSIFGLVILDAKNQSGEAGPQFARKRLTRHNGQFEVESQACPDDILNGVQSLDWWPVFTFASFEFVRKV